MSSGLRLLNPPCLPPQFLSSLSPATGDHIKGGISLGGHLTLGSGFRNHSPTVSRYLSRFLAKGDVAVCPTPFFPATHYISAAVASVCNLRLLTLSAVLQLQGLCAIFGRPQLCTSERPLPRLFRNRRPYLWADMCSWQRGKLCLLPGETRDSQRQEARRLTLVDQEDLPNPGVCPSQGGLAGPWARTWTRVSGYRNRS